MPVVRRGARGLGERGHAARSGSWAGTDELVTPRRSRCRGCRATHVLLPAQLFVEAGGCGGGDRPGAGGEGGGVRAPGDRGAARAAGIDGAGLAAGAGRNAGRVRERFTSLAASLVTDPPLPAPAGSPAADAVAAVAAAAAAAVLLPGVGGVARWELASAVTCGLLLAPSWPAVGQRELALGGGLLSRDPR